MTELKTLWSDVNKYEDVQNFETKHLSNAVYNLFEDIQCLKEQLKAAQPEVCMDNLRHCILMALNDCLVAEVGPGHSIINIDGEVLYNRVRGILDAITPLPAPPEKG